MEKVELVLPAGDEASLRAAVNNGADAVYLGFNQFNARRFAANFNEKNIASAIKYSHEHGVKVYVTFNIIVKNSELSDYLRLIGVAYDAGADAVIIQDPCLVQVVKDNFPDLKVQLSTQATVTNSYSVPKGVDRVIVARELSYDEINNISKEFEVEVFVHGALCFSYSGLCYFSSIVGTRSGNRGQCAQTCRQAYNNHYPLSSFDLCLLPKIPELIAAGVAAFKVEGRMRGAHYVATVARIYRKAIDSYYEGNFSYTEDDLSELKEAFGREFTQGFGFGNSIADIRSPVNKGIYIGKVIQGGIKIKEALMAGDNVALVNGIVTQHKITQLRKDNKNVTMANKGDFIQLDFAKEGSRLYRLSLHEKEINLGNRVESIQFNPKKHAIKLPAVSEAVNSDSAKIFVKAYNMKSAIAADKAKADVIYYDVLKDDVEEVKASIKNARFFVYTPWVASDEQLYQISEIIKKINPDGVLVGNRSLIKFIDNMEMHLDYSFNVFNDVDIASYNELPIISPELSADEVIELKNKNFIVQVHGDIVLMTTKQPMAAPELVDEKDRHFNVREYNGLYQILNSKQIGLFSKARKYFDNGIKYFYIDVKDEPDKYIRIYRKILERKEFDDSKIKKGYTTGHYARAVA